MRRSLVLLLWMATSTLMFSQLPSGTINGRVIDPQGNIVVGAHVTVTNNGKSLSRESLTNSDGLYTIPSLPPGVYDLRVESAGFAVSEAHNLALDVGTIATVNISLQIATAKDVVVVSGLNQTVDLTQSMIQGQIGSHTIESIPLNGRNFLELAYLVPGNRPAPTFDPTKTNTLEVSSAGSFGRGGNITVDGGDNNDEVVGGTLLESA